MTDDRMTLVELLQKSGDGDFLRTVAEAVLQILTEAHVEGLIGAGRHERTGDRLNYRNGYRDRSLDTRLGSLQLRIPKLRQGLYFPPFLEPRKTAEKALVTVIQEAWMAAFQPDASTSWCKRWVSPASRKAKSPSCARTSTSGSMPSSTGRLRAIGRISGSTPPTSRSAMAVAIVSVAAIIAVAVNTDGRREIIGLGIGPSEAEPFWSAFLKGLVKRGLKGVKLVISDAHDGLRHAITRVLGATWQRCRVHWMRNALAHVPKGQHTMVAAAIRQAFLQPDAEAARQTWRHVADQLRPRWPKLAALMDDSEHDVLAYMAFPAQHRTKLHSTNPLERLNKEVKRRADVVGIFPNEASITRLIGAVLLEQNDEWLLQHRYMQIEGMAELTPPLIDADPAKLPPMAA